MTKAWSGSHSWSAPARPRSGSKSVNRPRSVRPYATMTNDDLCAETCPEVRPPAPCGTSAPASVLPNLDQVRVLAFFTAVVVYVFCCPVVEIPAVVYVAV